MSRSQAAEAWRISFGTALPAGFLCRTAIPECWLRIHSLPESKRYPETDADRKELLLRHNAVASYTLGEGKDCTLFITRYGSEERWSATDQLPLDGLLPEHAMSSEQDEDQIQFFALRLPWRTGMFDERIMATAEDRTGPLMFVNTETRSAYAPYDGGADLFFHVEASLREANERFAAWRSNREDGL